MGAVEMRRVQTGVLSGVLLGAAARQHQPRLETEEAPGGNVVGLRSTGTSGSSDAISGVLHFSELCPGVSPLASPLLLLSLFAGSALVLTGRRRHEVCEVERLGGEVYKGVDLIREAAVDLEVLEVDDEDGREALKR
ncbi:hypothetical protein B0H14DRAFT_2589951 [Mycena olivaceomarginata]|nr:hypothetical protein B0H14DRAFT_2589951 [Mycena olivaceomarginata]